MNWLSVQTVSQISVERILNALPEGFLIALFAWVLLRVLRRQNSGTRFAVWFLALLTVAALPVLGGIGEGRALTAGMASGMTSGIPSANSWGSLRPAITIPGRWALGGDRRVRVSRVRVYLKGNLKLNNDRHVRVRARACCYRFLEADHCPSGLGVARTAGPRSERHSAARIRAPAALG